MILARHFFILQLITIDGVDAVDVCGESDGSITREGKGRACTGARVPYYTNCKPSTWPVIWPDPCLSFSQSMLHSTPQHQQRIAQPLFERNALTHHFILSQRTLRVIRPRRSPLSTVASKEVA